MSSVQYSSGAVVDVRTIVPRERHPLIFNTFHALAPGQDFILINDHDSKPLYYHFKAEYDGNATNIVTTTSKMLLVHSTSKKCWQCGVTFLCGPQDEAGNCWCNALPPISPTDGSDCLCQTCLSNRIAMLEESRSVL
jgi:uncharacterized protein (DUF2249 family)